MSSSAYALERYQAVVPPEVRAVQRASARRSLRRVIVVSSRDEHLRALDAVGAVEAFAFSSPSLALAAARSLQPHLFVVADEDAVDARRFHAAARRAGLSDAKVLMLVDGRTVDADFCADAVLPLWVDARTLRSHVRILLGA